MTNQKARGTERERKLVKLLQSEGWITIRTPGSLGSMDVIALKCDRTPRFIQVKRTVKPFTSFGSFERYDLLNDALKAGAQAELCWWPDHESPMFLLPDRWPETIRPRVIDKEETGS